MVGTQDRSSRPTAEAIVMDPYFWDSGKQLRFYSVSFGFSSFFTITAPYLAFMCSKKLLHLLHYKEECLKEKTGSS